MLHAGTVRTEAVFVVKAISVFLKYIGMEIHNGRYLYFRHFVNGVSSLLVLRFQLK